MLSTAQMDAARPDAAKPEETYSPDPQFAALLTAAPIGALILDAQDRVAWANPAAGDKLGMTAGEAISRMCIADKLEPAGARVFGALLASIRDRHAANPDDDSHDGSCQSGALTYTCTDGTTRELSFTFVAPSPPLAARGAVLAWVQRLDGRQVAERRFAQVFNNLPLGLLVVDRRQRILQANAALANVFGYRLEDLVGQPLGMLLPPRVRERHGGHVAMYSDAPTSRMMGSGRDLTGLHRSGKEFPVEIALTRLENAGRPAYMAIVSDISVRKRAETALQQTNAQLEEFTYVASHDLRSPLRGIGDLIGWIREDMGEDNLSAEVRHNFDRICLRIQRCEQMIDDLMDYARAGVRDPRMSQIDPAELIRDAVTMANVPEGFAVETDVRGEPFTAPRAPLATSLRNLVANAVKHHGGETGRIRIALHEEGRFSVFSVEDDGKGIAPGNEERIFKLFHRASPGTQGDGVGLAFTRRMINAHGGMVTVSGDGTLGGARFEIHWPRIALKEGEDE